MGTAALAERRRTRNFMAVRAQERLASAQGALPGKVTQQRQHFALDKTHPVEPPKFFGVAAAALFLHRLQ
jgi:hypothetical protein